MAKKGIVLCLSVFLVCLSIVAHTQEKAQNREVSERLIAQIDSSSWIAETFKVSQDNKRIAYSARIGEKWFVVVDGEEGKQYDGIMEGTPIFSPDSKRVAYGANVDEKCFVVVDGKEGKRYDGFVRGGRIVFDSPDSLHYLALIKNSIYLIEERIQ